MGYSVEYFVNFQVYWILWGYLPVNKGYLPV